MNDAGPIWEAIEKGAALFPAPDRGTVLVRGGERQSWLNGLITSDLAKLGPGVASYGLLLVKVGRILADAWVIDAGDRLLVAVPRDRVALVRDHLERHLVMEDAVHEDASDAFAWAQLHGPDASQVARDAAQAHAGFAGDFDATGFGGAFLAIDPRSMGAWQASFVAATQEEGRPRSVGDDADWRALRLARGLPAWGVDFSEKHYPQEAGLEKLAVSFNKGCYLGQEVVCRLEMRGHVIKKNALLEIEAAEPPAPGTEVHSSEGKPLGAVSSAARVPGHRFPLAIAMLRYDFSEPGTQVVVGQTPARVLDPPFDVGPTHHHA